MFMCSVLYSINKITGKYRKILALLCIAVCFILPAGCQEKNSIKSSTNLGVSKQVYNGINVSCISAGENRSAYIAVITEDASKKIIKISADGTQKEFDIPLINKNKEIMEITSMVLSEGNIYIAVNAGASYDDGYLILYKMNLEEKNMEVIGEYPEYCNARKLIFTDGNIIMLVQDKNRKEVKPLLDNPDDIFEYGGEVLISQEGKVLFDDFPVACDIMDNNEIIMYAHSDNGGFYFINLTIKNGSIAQKSEPVFKDLKQLMSLTVTDGRNLIYTSRVTDVQGLLEINLSNNTSSEIQPEKGVISRQGDICYSGGVTFYITEGGINCFTNSECKKDNKVIRVIESENIGFLNAPYGCGYQMDIEQLNNDEMLLHVLSQSPDYDICFMQSGDPFGLQVKEKGSFYPLTEINGVKEYLNACFPYLKEAAMGKDGEIWMLPVAVTADCLVYDSQMLKDEGININDIENLEGFISAIKKLPVNKAEYVNTAYSVLEDILLHDYACRNESFNTEQFKELSSILLQISGDGLFTWHNIASDALSKHIQNQFLCSIERGSHFLKSVCTNPYVNVCKVFGTDKEKPLSVKCYFICVNAATDNISASISYIETLCSYLMQKKDTMMLTDKSKYTDTEITSGLYNLYADGEAVFAIPGELYMEEWEKYKSGKINFKQMVEEADRKVKMYKEE